MIWLLPILVISLALFTTLNIALRAPSRARLTDLFERSGDGGAWERFIQYRPQFTLMTALLRAVSVLAVLATALSLVVTTDAQGRASGAWTAFLVALLIVLVFGIAVPNAWAKYGGERLLVGTLPLLHFIRVLLYPVIFAMLMVDPVIRRLCGVRLVDEERYSEEVQEMLSTVSEMERQGTVDVEEKEMIESVIEMRDTLVENIMTPRTQMAALPKEATLADVKRILREKGHSRYPVYDGTIDTILGMLYVKDILRLDNESDFATTRVMRKVLFIPESKPVRDLLRELREGKVHVAVVLDEYGGTAGLVTIEDILEELVGDIADEYDVNQPAAMRRIDENTVEVDARMRVEDLNDALDLELPEADDYDTIGGLVFHTLGKIPRVGERFEQGPVAVQIIGAEPNRVTRVRLHITRQPQEAEAE